MSKRWVEDHELVNGLAANLLDAMTVFPKRFIRQDALIHAFGMPLSQIQILLLLSENDLSITELAQRTGIAKPNITPLVDSLEEKAMIVRQHSTEDRRVVHLHLCEAGEQRVQELREAVAGQIAEWSTQFSRSEARELNNAVMTLIRLAGQE